MASSRIALPGMPFFSMSLAKQLCDKDGLIVYLFQLMEINELFENAAGFVEEILAVREESFDLSRIRKWQSDYAVDLLIAVLKVWME